jgi:hypothetical protein
MDIRIDPEHIYRDRLALAVHGKTEVILSCGRIDVLTDTHVYEVKHIRMWKQAMGQALVYAAELGRLPAVALFGPPPDAPQLESMTAAAVSLEVEMLYLDERGRIGPLLHIWKHRATWNVKDYQIVLSHHMKHAKRVSRIIQALTDELYEEYHVRTEDLPYAIDVY